MQGTVRGAREVTAENSSIVGLDTAAVDHAVRLIHQVCCFAGSFDLVEEFRDPALCAAVERHDTAALFDRLIYRLQLSRNLGRDRRKLYGQHGQATWALSSQEFGQATNLPEAAKLLAFSRLPIREDEPHLRRA